MTVVLDTQVTPELAAEGLAREVLSRVQSLRKDAGLSVSQRIALFVDANGPVSKMLDNGELSGLIQRETLAVSLSRSTSGDFPGGAYSVPESIDGEAVGLALTPA